MAEAENKNGVDKKSAEPEDPYPDRRDQLLQLLRSHGVDALSFQHFLDETEISHGLRGLLGLAINLSQILPLIADAPQNHLHTHSLVLVCAAVLKCKSEDLSAIDSMLLERSENLPGLKPLKNLYPSRPLHCFLWHNNKWVQSKSEFTRFKANFFLAYRRLADGKIEFSKDPDYEPASTFLGRCCLAGRKVAFIDQYHPEAKGIALLRQNLSDKQSFEEYCGSTVKYIQQLLRTGHGLDAVNPLRDLKNLFSGKFPGARDSSDNDLVQPPPSPPPPSEPRQPPPSPTPPSEPRSPRPPFIHEEKLDSRLDTVVVTIDAGEGKNHGGQVVKAKFKVPKYTTAEDKYLFMAHRGRVNAIAMSNQNLPWSWDRISDYELATVRAHLASPIEFGRYGTAQQEVAPETLRAFISFALFAGRSGANFCAVQPGKPAIPDDDRTCYHEGTLNFPTFEPQTDVQSGSLGSRPHTRRLQVRLAAECRSVIDHWQGLIGKSGSSWGEGLAAGTLETAADRWLADLNRASDTRLTISRIKAHLYRTLTARLDSDEAMAIAITGSLRPNGFSPASYQALHPAVLQRHYDLVFRNDVLPQDINVPLSERDDYIGSAKVPRSLRTRLLANSLQNQIRLKGLYEYHEPFVRLHNLYAIYTHLVIGFSTGFRGTVNPFSHPAYFDPATSELVLSEKDRSNFAHSRPVWIPRVAADQIAYYLEHLRAVEANLVLHDPGLTGGRLAHRQPYPKLLRDRKQQINSFNAEAVFIFLLDQDGKRTAISPTIANAWLEANDFQPMHDNAWRQAYRTLLRESNCPDRVIRTAMGHWRTGEEGFYRYSALLPEVYRSILDQHITRIIRDQGWFAMESPLAYRP